jgi:predicted DNA binding CopG/RHH family protein
MGQTKRTLKRIPRFSSEDEERMFWAEHDSADFLDWSDGELAVFPDLKPTTSTISLRIPDILLHQLKQLANKKDVPYQSLLKMFLSERVAKELRTNTSAFKRNRAASAAKNR